MFQNTCKSLLETIMPIVVALRCEQGKVGCGIGAGMIINDDGWFITAGHILKEIVGLEQQVVNHEPGRRRKRKRKRNQVTHYAAIFGQTNARLTEALVQEELDLGVGKLEGCVMPVGHVYPQFRVREVEQGELLCRLGYPFVDSNPPHLVQRQGVFVHKPVSRPTVRQ